MKPTKTPIKMTDLKFFPRRMAILAGRTIIVETNRAPAAGIVNAIVTDEELLASNPIYQEVYNSQNKGVISE